MPRNRPAAASPPVEDKLRNALRPGHKLHWYRIERVLGQGGFGITYLAHDANLDQQVAIKEYLPMELAVREGDFSVYPASQAQDSRYKWGLERFLTEARTLARFRHPAIVRVMSVFESNNTAYMVMEYQHGESLQHLLDLRGTLPERELVALVIPLLDGLETIHVQGFIHRDIKPSNVFIRSDGHPVLLDFGSARQALGEETRALTSVVSPGYAPFEQYYSKSDRQGPWTDIYGLGATLYRCISGLQPMAAIDRSEAILKAERDMFVSANELGAGQYSPGFLAAIDCALEFNEKKRPQTIAEWRPRFGFAGDITTEIVEPRQAPFDGQDRTRFSHVADPLTQVTSAVVNEDTRRSGRSQRPRSLLQDPGTQRTASRSGLALDEAGADRPARRWALVVAALVLIAGVVAYAGHAGWLPFDAGSSSKAARMVVLGDRALAAGRVFEPAATSALAYYRRAYLAHPGDEGAQHGLSLSGERLIEALNGALADQNFARVEMLAPLLDLLPPGSVNVDLGELRNQIAAARALGDQVSQRRQRIDAYLTAAADDVANGQLVGAGTDNALARYRAIQTLEPDNAEAAAGITAVARALAGRGHQALADGELISASDWHEQARQLAPQEAAVVALGSAVAAAEQAKLASAERNRTIDELLAGANADLAANRLTTPPQNNAFDRLQEILRLDPANAQAARGMRAIHDRYVAMATQALTRDEFAQASQHAAKALEVEPDSDAARTLQREIGTLRTRREREAAERLAAQAEAEAAEQAARQAGEERAQLAAAEQRRRVQEAEASRLLAEAEARAAAERAAAAAELKAEQDAIAAIPRMVLDFQGFLPKYARDGISRDWLYEKVAPKVRAAGYEIVTRGDVHDAGYSWTNVKLMAFRLSVNENTATGLYSYSGSLNVLPHDTLILPLSAALKKSPLWNRGHNGLGPPTDLSRLLDQMVEITSAFLATQPARRQ